MLRSILLSLSWLTASCALPPSEFTFEIGRTGVIQVGQRVGANQRQRIGTGFAVDSNCTFVTAKHVLVKISDRRKLVISYLLPKDKTVVRNLPGEVVYEDPQSDLAFIRVAEPSIDACISDELYVFPLLDGSPTADLVGAPITIIGHPVLAGQSKTVDIPVLRKGHISSVEISSISSDPGPEILLDLLGVPGFSGGPVILDTSGVVIGIVYGPARTARASGFEWATPINVADYERAIDLDGSVR